MQLAGIEGEQVVLLLEDHQFVEPQFLELINSLLSAGEVPGLYTPEEVEPLLSPLREMASDAGFRGTLVQFFASRESEWDILENNDKFRCHMTQRNMAEITFLKMRKVQILMIVYLLSLFLRIM